MAPPLPFSEGGYDLLPEKWRDQCLGANNMFSTRYVSNLVLSVTDLSGLLEGVDASLHSDTPMPLEQPQTDAFSSSSLPVNPSTVHLPPSLSKYPQNRRLAALLLQELDHCHVFLSHERKFLKADWLAILALAKKYTTMNFQNGEDPYIRSRLKDALVHLYHERAAHVTYRMITHGIVQRVLQHHATQMTASVLNKPNAAKESYDEKKNQTIIINSSNAVRNNSVGNDETAIGATIAVQVKEEKEEDLFSAFMTFVMKHPFFAMSVSKNNASPTSSSSVAPPDNINSIASSSLNCEPKDINGQEGAEDEEEGIAMKGLVSEEEVAILHAQLFCHGDVEVARAVLTYHTPHVSPISASTRISSPASSPLPLMFPTYSSENFRIDYEPVNTYESASQRESSYLSSVWNMIRGITSQQQQHHSSSTSSSSASSFPNDFHNRKNYHRSNSKVSSSFCYGIFGGWGSGDGLFGVLSSGGPFGLGLRMGICGVLLVWVLWDCLVDDDMGKEVWHDPAFKVYRGLGNVVILCVCWGIDVLVWKRAGIDYERFLRLHPCAPGIDPSAAIFNIGLDLAIAFLLSLICFWKSLRGVFLRGVPPAFAHLFPISLFFYIAYRALTPWKKRKFLYLAVYEVIVAPFGSTAFKEGFVGDVLTSTVRPLIDLSFSILYFLGGVSGWYYHSIEYPNLAEDRIEGTMFFSRIIIPSITLLPLWWRFCQNLQRSYDTRERWPHLGNAMKYAAAANVALYGLFHKNAKNHIVWIFAFVFATLYQFWWDIFMDWDLVRIQRINKKSKKNARLCSFLFDWSISFRRPLLYRRRSFYIAIALANFVLRFFWTLTLIPEGGVEAWQNTIQVRLSPVLAGAEICRRCVWAFLRVENEHLHTYGTAIDDGFTYDEAIAIGSAQMEPMSVSDNKRKGLNDGNINGSASSSKDGVYGSSDNEDGEDFDELSPLQAQSITSPVRYKPLTIFGLVITSSTASLTNNQVLFELTLLAAFVVALGTFIAVGI